jgi:hypothetical protein
VLHGGRAHTAEVAPEDADFLGLPGLLTPEQTATLLAVRDADIRKSGTLFDELDVAGNGTHWRDVDALRKEVAGLVRQWAARTSRNHAEIHGELRKVAPGPPSAAAPVEVLMARRDYLLGKVG